MRVRIIKEEDGNRTYYVDSGDRRHPALASASGVTPEQRKAAKEILIADVVLRMRPGQQALPIE